MNDKPFVVAIVAAILLSPRKPKDILADDVELVVNAAKVLVELAQKKCGVT